MIEEMAASYWRLRRAWAIETCLMDQAIAQEGSAEPLDRITGAFRSLTGSGSLALLHRYETRLHSMYQRALRNLLLLRAVSAAPGGAAPAFPPPLEATAVAPEQTDSVPPGDAKQTRQVAENPAPPVENPAPRAAADPKIPASAPPPDRLPGAPPLSAPCASLATRGFR